MRLKCTNIRDREWCVDQHISQEKPLKLIRRETGLGINTIRRWFRYHDIPIRDVEAYLHLRVERDMEKPESGLSETELAYIAGIIDGEGTISIAKQREGKGYQARVTVGMTFFDIPLWIHAVFGGSVYIRKFKTNKQKDACIVTLTGSSARRILTELYPYLILKKPQADVAFKFWEISDRKGSYMNPEDKILQEAEYVAIRAMNRKGKGG